MCVGCMMATADAPCGNCEDEDGSTPGAVPAGWGSGVRMSGTVPAGPPNPVSFLPASIVPPKASHDLPPQRADSEEAVPALRIASQADEHQLMMNMLAEQQREMHEEELRVVCSRLREAVALREKYKQPVEKRSRRGSMVESFVDESMTASFSHYDEFDPFVAPEFHGRPYAFEMRDGVMVVWDSTEEVEGLAPRDAFARRNRAKAGVPSRESAFTLPPDLRTYTADLTRLLQICSDAAVNSFCYSRLKKLEARFHLHVMEHELAETTEQRAVRHRDFYNIRKVDTHVHLAVRLATARAILGARNSRRATRLNSL